MEAAGYRVVVATDGLDGLKKLYEAYPDLIILARELPMVNGEDSYLRIRQASYLPIIVVGSEDEAAETLELGADAYMTKPPSPNELVARVRAILRRKPKDDDTPTGSSHLNIESHLDDNGGDGSGSNELTPTEYHLASCLIHNKGRLLGYPQLINEVWGEKRISIDTLHFYVRRLRNKLANFSIFGLRGVSYCFSGDGGTP